MERKVYGRLVEWKSDPERKPLIIEGVRQCGKTYILKEFGKLNYGSTAYFNFEKEPSIRELWSTDLDPIRIIRELSILRNRPIRENDTLIVFDEVQNAPEVLTSLKYFNEEAPEYHVVCAGSLLGLLTSKPRSFPVGNVERIRMYPMDFLEFLKANGEDSLTDYLQSHDLKTRIPLPIHEKLSDYLRNYMVVGGMPKAVESWTLRHNKASITRILRNIAADYKDDFSKHCGNDLEKVVSVWESMPLQLAKENRRFMFGHVKTGSRAKDLEGAVTWLVNAGLAHRVNCVEDPAIPLKGCHKPTMFKLYMSDIGLLRVLSSKSDNKDIVDADAEKDYRGAMTENYVLLQLLSNGIEDVFYWKKGAEEVDFLIDGDHGPVPIEVKAGENLKAKSLKSYVGEYSPKDVFLVSMKDAIGGNMGNTPLYLSGMIPGQCKNVVEHHMEHDDGTFSMRFSASSWKPSDDGFRMDVPASEHGVDSPDSVSVHDKKGIELGTGVVGRNIDRKGNVIIDTDLPFDGIITIR